MAHAPDKIRTPGRTPRIAAPAALAAALILAVAIAPAPADAPMASEQLYEVPRGHQYISERLEALIGAAMERPEQTTRIAALHEVRRHEMDGLAEHVVTLLGDRSPIVRAAAAQAADTLDARDAADALLAMIEPNAAPSDPEREQTLLADGMLGRWGDGRGSEAWATRVSDRVGPSTLQVSAARALGRAAADRSAAWEVLSEAVADAGRPATVRLAAADALADLDPATPDAVPLAERLIESGRPFGPLLAARVLRHADSSEATALLRRLSADREPAVQAIALRRMLELDPALVWDEAERAFASPDPKVRRITVESFTTRRRTDSIPPLADMLNDPHPDVRNDAREVMRGLAAEQNLLAPTLDALHAIVERGAGEGARLESAESEETPAPDAEHWRATEQAALLLGELDDKPSADRLVALFDHTRPEVPRAAVIALRRLDVPETRRPMVALLDRTIGRAVDADPNSRDGSIAGRLAYEVNQTMGVWRVEEADELLRRQIPKNFATGEAAREAAIWALGLLHEVPTNVEPADIREDQELVSALMGRVNDMAGIDPERPRVRLAAAVALGRMRAHSQVDRLMSRYQGDPLFAMESAARWAVMNITGEHLPPIETSSAPVLDSFLSPLDE